MNIPANEILRSQNIIPRCDFWFAITGIDGAYEIPDTARVIIKRSETQFDWMNEFDTSKLNPSSTVYCKFDYLEYLISYLNHRKCKTPFILITGQSDFPITNDVFDAVRSKINIRWHGCNNQCNRAGGIPLGIADDFCTLTVKDNFEQTTGEKLLYVNHRIETYPSERLLPYTIFKDKSWATVETPTPKGNTDTYKKQLTSHKFIVCPRGNGIDTHRIWEALYCGVIPIVKRNVVHKELEGNLPILFVDSYEQVDKSFLDTTYDTFKTKSWNMDMLKVSWWLQKIKT
jgi:hypothetical protein